MVTLTAQKIAKHLDYNRAHAFCLCAQTKRHDVCMWSEESEYGE